RQAETDNVLRVDNGVQIGITNLERAGAFVKVLSQIAEYSSAFTVKTRLVAPLESAVFKDGPAAHALELAAQRAVLVLRVVEVGGQLAVLFRKLLAYDTGHFCLSQLTRED